MLRRDSKNVYIYMCVWKFIVSKSFIICYLVAFPQCPEVEHSVSLVTYLCNKVFVSFQFFCLIGNLLKCK